MVKNLPANAGDAGSIPGSGRFPEVGNNNPLQCSCLVNPLDRGAWWAIVHGVTKSRAGGAPQKERGSGTSLSKAEESRGEVSLLSANPAPPRVRDNQTRQGFRLSSSTLLPQTLGLYRQARGFCEGWANHIKGQIVICHSCTNHQLKVKSSCASL